ncbi:hypothetical protein KFK09_022720 [Dendrobium nobile]|uniref:Reverse transcriptase domain-containing protein n=1 Tax=Dendrobium nobile TaxID=94219 RepID=A0A8T3AK43_DENNO|nr:hypothetical protein KFK09_022720 [Dendrobium nobile]
MEDWPYTLKILKSKEKELLFSEFTVEEIDFVIKNLVKNIAPGGDGVTYSIKFYWKIIKEDFVKALNHFLNLGSIDCNWKDTLVIFIPKVSNPLLPTNYRPISLCNSVYKVVAKIILNRLTLIIPLLISKEQAAFIRGRSISGHILIAQEMFHKFRYSKAAKGMVSFKADMKQAYDSMSWKTLKQVLNYFDFPDMISKLILECVLNPRFFIIINGKLSRWINAESRFRQGCPLSPILFILCSQLLTNAFSHSSTRIGLCSKSPSISNLLFADDVMVFSEASRKVVYEVKSILSDFGLWTGQSINERNLPFPLGVIMVTSDYYFIIEKALRLLNTWGTKYLSLAGKIILIKIVILAIPNYYSSHSLVQAKVLKEINKIYRGFIWKKSSGNPGLHYLSWENLCKPLKEGGCGLFSSTRSVAPLRTRLSWRFLNNKDSLLHRTLAPKYGTRFGKSEIKKFSSSWKILCNGGKVLDPFIRWKVANGDSINVFKDKWILDRSNNEWPTFVVPQGDGELFLNNFIEDGIWNEDKLKKIFGKELVDLILKIKIYPNQDKDDRELIYQDSGRSIPGMISGLQH